MKFCSVIVVLLSLCWQIGVCPNGCAHHHGFFDQFESDHHQAVTDGDDHQHAPTLTDSHECDGHGRLKFNTDQSRHRIQWDFSREQAAPFDSAKILGWQTQTSPESQDSTETSFEPACLRARLQRWVV